MSSGWFRAALVYLLLLVAVTALIFSISPQSKKPEGIPITQLASDVGVKIILLIIATITGLVFTFLGYFRGPAKTVYANSGTDAGLLFGILIWIAGLCLTYSTLPLSVFHIFALIWIVVWYFAAEIYNRSLRMQSMTYVGVYIAVWNCYVRMPRIARMRSSFDMEIGLKSSTIDLKTQVESNEDLEKLKQELREGVRGFGFSRFSETALIEKINLNATTPLTLRLSAPAFDIQPLRQVVTIKELERRPAHAMLLCKYPGNQSIRVEFCDDEGYVHGGMTVPVQVKLDYLLVLEWIFLSLRYVGPLLTVIASALLVALKLLP